MADQVTKKTPRRHVTTACSSCRETKVKCDGGRPQCSNCVSRNKTCSYPVKEDKRKVSLRTAVELLANRVVQLTSLLEENGIQPPEIKAEDRDFLDEALRVLQVGSLPTNGTKSKSASRSAKGDSPAAGQAVSDATIPAEVFHSPSGANAPAFRDPIWLGDGTVNNPQLDVDYAMRPLSAHASDLNSPDWPWDVYGSSVLTMQSAQNPTTALYTNSVYDESANIMEHLQDQAIDTPEEEDTDLMKQLSHRLGALRLASDGKMRFFGGSSNMHLLERERSLDEEPEIRDVERDGQELLEKAGVGKAVPVDLEEHLTELYFRWHDTCFHAVDKDTYDDAKQRWRGGQQSSDFYSDVLSNAICAVGAAYEAKYHPTFTTYPRPLAEFFADRAKILLEIELDSPCIATSQALCVLTSHEIVCKRDTRAWLYSGTSMRLALDLGLHIEHVPYVQAGKMSPEEMDARQTAFWGSYIVNHLFSIYLGRPFTIDTAELTVEKPSLTLFRSSHSQASKLSSTTSTSASPADLPPNILRQANLQWILLCELIGPVSHDLYGNAKISKEDLQTTTSRITEQLFHWIDFLPAELKIDYSAHSSVHPAVPDPVPAPHPSILTLHLQYHQFLILLHRPWTARSSQPSRPQGRGHTHARAVCIEAALAIAKLLRRYEVLYTFRRMHSQVVHVILSAALIMIFASVERQSGTAQVRSPDAEGEHDIASQLAICFRALGELSQTFDNARSTRDFLFAVQKKWRGMNKGKNKNKNKNKNRNRSSDDSVEKKGRKRSVQNLHYDAEAEMEALSKKTRQDVSRNIVSTSQNQIHNIPDTNLGDGPTDLTFASDSQLMGYEWNENDMNMMLPMMLSDDMFQQQSLGGFDEFNLGGPVG